MSNQPNLRRSQQRRARQLSKADGIPYQTAMHRVLADAQPGSSSMLVQSVGEVQAEARAYYETIETLPLGIPQLEACLPKSGYRRGWLGMVKSVNQKIIDDVQLYMAVALAERGEHSVIITTASNRGAIRERLAALRLGEPLQRYRKPATGLAEEATPGADQTTTVDTSQERSLIHIVELLPGENMPHSEPLTTDRIRQALASVQRKLAPPRTGAEEPETTTLATVFIDRIVALSPREAPAPGENSLTSVNRDLFVLAKATNLSIWGGCLAEEVPAGVSFGYDVGPAGLGAVDFCDLIIGAWTGVDGVGGKQQQQSSSASASADDLGLCSVALIKNRYGPHGISIMDRGFAGLRIPVWAGAGSIYMRDELPQTTVSADLPADAR